VTAGVAVLTGAAGAFGRAIGSRLGRCGFVLVLVDRTPAVEDVASTLRSEGCAAQACVEDLTEPGAADRVAATAGALRESVMALVNNAGITRDGRLAALDEDAFTEVLEVNLLAPMRLSQAIRPLLGDGSAVVNMGSRAGLGNFGQANYVTSKSALVGFTRALALQLGPRSRVNAVAPGLVDTPMTRDMPADVLAKLVSRVPLARIGTPDDVAAAVEYLVTPASAYVTGQVLTVCGGRSLAR
jgi:3-oxoacyl-[acyl-carrier protein] reductase